MNILRARICLVSIHICYSHLKWRELYKKKKKKEEETNVYKHKLISELIEFLSKWNNVWGVKWKQNFPLQYCWE